MVLELLREQRPVASSKEWLRKELADILDKSPKPSVELNKLRDRGIMKQYAPLQNLVGCGQNPLTHLGDDAWDHTMQALDHFTVTFKPAMDYSLFASSYGLLFHDVGKQFAELCFGKLFTHCIV